MLYPGMAAPESVRIVNPIQTLIMVAPAGMYDRMLLERKENSSCVLMAVRWPPRLTQLDSAAVKLAGK